MIRCSADGVVFYRFESLSGQTEIEHAVFTRLGGASSGPFASLNVGHRVGDDPAAVETNHRRIFDALGLPAEHSVSAHQVHASRVARVDLRERGAVIPATDALITSRPGVPLLLRFADCVPVLLYAPSQRAIGLVHAGWRGVVAGVVPATLAAMQQAFGCAPQDVVAAIGPAIGPCCYQVSADVSDQIVHAAGDHAQIASPARGGTGDHRYVDLPGAARCQLESAGVRRVQVSGLCTSCHPDEFFSHRAEAGRTGRFAAVLALR